MKIFIYLMMNGQIDLAWNVIQVRYFIFQIGYDYDNVMIEMYDDDKHNAIK